MSGDRLLRPRLDPAIARYKFTQDTHQEQSTIDGGRFFREGRKIIL